MKQSAEKWQHWLGRGEDHPGVIDPATAASRSGRLLVQTRFQHDARKERRSTTDRTRHVQAPWRNDTEQAADNERALLRIRLR